MTAQPDQTLRSLQALPDANALRLFALFIMYALDNCAIIDAYTLCTHNESAPSLGSLLLTFDRLDEKKM